MQSPIPLDAFAPSLARTRFFPPAAYTSPDFHRFEMDAVWRREWIAVGRAEEIPNPGDYVSVRIGDEPVLLIRDDDGTINALSPVCRHRAMLVADGAGHCKGRLVCPYHRWTYDKSGALIGAPDMNDAPGFSRADNGLPRIATTLWRGIIFVNLDGAAPPLAHRLAALEPFVDTWRLGDLLNETVVDPKAKMHFDYHWNWKVYAEGQSECYHCDKLHGDTPSMQGIDFSSMTMRVDDPTQGVFAFSLKTKTIDHTLNHLGRAVFPAIPWLTEDERWMSYSIIIAPNIFMQLMADCVIMLMWFPRTAETMAMKRFRIYPRATLERDDFLAQRAPEREAARYFVTQDDVAFEQVQQGLRSSFAPRGPISPKEPVLSGLNEWLTARYLAAST